MVKATDEEIDLKLNPIQAFAFRELSDSERGVEYLEDIAKLTTLTNNQVVAFSRLPQLEKTFANLKIIAQIQLTDDQLSSFEALPDSNRNIMKLKSI